MQLYMCTVGLFTDESACLQATALGKLGQLFIGKKINIIFQYFFLRNIHRLIDQQPPNIKITCCCTNFNKWLKCSHRTPRMLLLTQRWACADFLSSLFVYIFKQT